MKILQAIKKDLPKYNDLHNFNNLHEYVNKITQSNEKINVNINILYLYAK